MLKRPYNQGFLELFAHRARGLDLQTLGAGEFHRLGNQSDAIPHREASCRPRYAIVISPSPERKYVISAIHSPSSSI